MNSKLFKLQGHFAEIPLGLPLVCNLNGFTDAGGTSSQLAQHLFTNLQHELVATFLNDELLDYRSRRPLMYFDKDHIADYDAPELALYLVEDDANQKFLLLNGYEPDFRWEEFTDELVKLVQQLEISGVTWVHSIPFPTPHTRPLGMTVSGNRVEMIDQFSEWKPQTQVPGNVLHLLEYKASQAEIDVVGFVLLVPHYLSESDFPLTALTAVEQIMAATGLVIPSDDLRAQNNEFAAKLNAQVAESEDLQKMVQALENGYGSEKMGPIRAPIRKPETRIPDAEEIAIELEEFLAKKNLEAEE